MSEKIDEEQEFIKTILQRTSEESFITSNYLLIEESTLNFSFDDITEEDFVEILTEMKETISKVQEGYENAYMNLDRWTLEIATGDRMFREGLKEWDEGLDCLFKYCKDRDEEYINRGIKKIYEGNKKLIINQKIEEYVDEQVKLLQKEGHVSSDSGEKEISSLSRPVEKPVITGNVVPVTGHMPLLPQKEEKTEEKSNPIRPASVPSIKIDGKSSPSETVIYPEKSEKISEVKISEAKIPEAKIPEAKIPEIKIPEAKISEAKIPEAKIPEAKIPEVKIPEAKIPEAKIPEAKIPEAKIPEAKIPEAKIPEAKIPEAKISEAKISEAKIPEAKIPEAKIPEAKISEKVVEDEIIDKIISPPSDQTSPDLKEKKGSIYTEELHITEKEEQVEQAEMDETSGKKAMRKPAGLSKRVRKSTHGESNISDIASDDNTEKKSIRRPAGLSRKAGKKKED